jgi:hypothetical protein
MNSELGLWLTEEEVEALVEVLPVDEHANVHYMDFVDSAFDNIQLMYAQKDPHVGCTYFLSFAPLDNAPLQLIGPT